MSSILDELAGRGKNANNGIKKINESTADEIVSNSINTSGAETTEDLVKGLLQNQTKKRINVSLTQDTFQKLITVAGGKSVAAVMEKILTNAVKDVQINQDIVNKYTDTMKNKCKK